MIGANPGRFTAVGCTLSGAAPPRDAVPHPPGCQSALLPSQAAESFADVHGIRGGAARAWGSFVVGPWCSGAFNRALRSLWRPSAHPRTSLTIWISSDSSCSAQVEQWRGAKWCRYRPQAPARQPLRPACCPTPLHTHRQCRHADLGLGGRSRCPPITGTSAGRRGTRVQLFRSPTKGREAATSEEAPSVARTPGVVTSDCLRTAPP